MDNICLVKAQANKTKSKFNILSSTSEKLWAQKVDKIPAKTLKVISQGGYVVASTYFYLIKY